MQEREAAGVCVDGIHAELTAGGEVEALLGGARVPIARGGVGIGPGFQDGREALAGGAGFRGVLGDRPLLEFVVGHVVKFTVAVQLVTLVAGETDFSKLILIPAGAGIVMTKHPRAGSGGLAEELRIKADAIEPCGGGDGPAGGFHDGG